MKLTEPKLEDRKEQRSMGIRTQVTMDEMSTGVIPQLIGEVFDWLEKHDVALGGVPFMRFHVITMTANSCIMDLEIGVPVASDQAGDDRVRPGVLPAGQYASLIYTGVTNGIPANKALLDWGAEQGLVWDRWDMEEGDAFRSRFESFLTDPKNNPDPATWETEVAIRLADK